MQRLHISSILERESITHVQGIITVQGKDRERYIAALDYAARHHAGQTRKGKKTPYVSHVISVSGIVLENGGDMDQAVAALLHDLVEDCDTVTHQDILELFGPRVAQIVEDCTDTLPGDNSEKKSPWKLRKDRYLETMKRASEHSLLVAAADKRHNLGSMVADLRIHGVQSLERFSAAPTQQRWYFQEFIRITKERIPKRLNAELQHLLNEFCALAELERT